LQKGEAESQVHETTDEYSSMDKIFSKHFIKKGCGIDIATNG